MHCKILLLLLVLQLAFFSLISQTKEQLRANLYSYNTDSSLSLNDGNLTMYSLTNNNAIDGMDALKMTNFGENFGLLRGNKTLAIERRQRITAADTIFFRMWNMRRKSYQLVLSLTGLNHPGLAGILKDKYLHTTTLLNLNGATSAVFSITNDTASSAPNRFSIVFSLPSSPYYILPITFTGIKAYRNNLFNGQAGNNTTIQWAVENEKDILQYSVEKSINGRHFYSVYSMYPEGKSLKNYKWTDNSPLNRNNFYRINSVDINGKVQFSNIAIVKAAKENNTFSIYPNPVVNGSFYIQIGDQPSGTYVTKLINLNGQVVSSIRMQHTALSSAQTINVNTMAKGNYILEIITPDNNITSRKITIQ